MNVYPYAVISINEMFQIAEFQYLVDICLRSEMTWELFMNVSNDEIDLRVINKGTIEKLNDQFCAWNYDDFRDSKTSLQIRSLNTKRYFPELTES